MRCWRAWRRLRSSESHVPKAGPFDRLRAGSGAPIGKRVTITIRKALAADAEGVTACLESAFEPFRSQYTRGAFEDTVPSVEAIRERMAHMTVYAAVTSDGRIVGTVASAAHGEEGHLRGMAVHPEWQGRSIAEQLLRTVESELLAAGCLRITLDTTDPLQRAVRFYRRNGFVPSGRVADFFGMPLHEYVKPLMPRQAPSQA
jgi:ribosomal protein S18 acetylase RimI-like enzyme